MNIERVSRLAVLLGFAVYAVVRISYSIFYGSVGVRPEEIGLGFSETIADAAVGLAVVGIAVTIALFAAVTVYGWIKGKETRDRVLAAQIVWVLVPVGLIVILVAVTVFKSISLLGDMQHGRPVNLNRSVNLVTSLPVHAEAVHVDWLMKAPRASGDLSCVLYLGAASGTAVLYRPLDNATIRLPQADVLITSIDVEACPTK